MLISIQDSESRLRFPLYYDDQDLTAVSVEQGRDWPGGLFDAAVNSPVGQIHIAAKAEASAKVHSASWMPSLWVLPSSAATITPGIPARCG